MIQMYYIYCVLYFYYYYVSSMSHHQALDPRGWGPLLYFKRGWGPLLYFNQCSKKKSLFLDVMEPHMLLG